MSLKKLWKKHDMFLVRKHLPAEAESNQEKKRTQKKMRKLISEALGKKIRKIVEIAGKMRKLHKLCFGNVYTSIGGDLENNSGFFFTLQRW